MLQKKLIKRQRQSAKKEVAPEYSVGSRVWVRIHRQSKKDKRQTKKIFMLYDGPYVIKELVKPNVYLIADQEGEVVGVYNCRQLRPHREPFLRNVPDRREAASERVDEVINQDSGEDRNSSELELSDNIEPVRYQLRARKGQQIQADDTKISDSRKRSVGDGRRRRWYDGKQNQGNRLPVIHTRERFSSSSGTSGKRMRLRETQNEDSNDQTDRNREHYKNNYKVNKKYSYNKRYVDTSNSDLGDTTESEYAYGHANTESSDEEMLELCMMVVEDNKDQDEDDEVYDEQLPGTCSEEGVQNGGVQQQEELCQESKESKGFKISTSSSGPSDGGKTYIGPGYLQAFNVITKVIKKPVMKNTIFGITCEVYVDVSAETNFVSDHFLNGIITGAYSLFISIHKLIDNGHLYTPAKHYMKCKLQINNVCNNYSFVALDVPMINAIIIGRKIVSYILRSRILVSDVAGRTIKFFGSNSNFNRNIMSSEEEKFENYLKEWERIEKEKDELSKLKRMQDDRLKEFENLIERKRKDNTRMRKQLKKRDEILKRVGLKPVLPYSDAEVVVKKQYKKESAIEISNKKIAIKKIPAKAVHVISKRNVDMQRKDSKVGSAKNKKEKGQVQFHRYEDALQTTAAKAIRKGNASPKLMIQQRISERKYRKYFFNEDSEEEIVSSEEEKSMDKRKPIITNVQNVQIKLPRLTNQEINRAIHYKLESRIEEDQIMESVSKVRYEIDQLRKNIGKEPEEQDREIRKEDSPKTMEEVNNEDIDQLPYEMIKEHAEEMLEETVHLDAIPIPDEVLPEEIIQTTQFEVLASLPDETSEPLTIIVANEEINQIISQEMENQDENLQAQIGEGSQQDSKGKGVIIDEKDSDDTETQKKENVQAHDMPEQQVN